MARAVPAVPQAQPNQPITAADWNAFVYAVGFHVHPPLALLVQNAVQSIPSGATAAAVAFDSAERDSDGSHDGTSSNSRFTAPVPGVYQVTATGALATPGTAGGEWSVAIVVGGTVTWAMHQMTPTAGASFYGCASADIPLGAGDYVEAQLKQITGAAVSTVAGACRLLARWVGT